MRPLTLSKKSNPLGEIMNLQDAFAKLKQSKHDSSFENLGEWLNNNSKPGKMKSIYKIAASFILAGLIFIACSMPVQQEEEIGYMIKGLASVEVAKLKTNLAQIPNINLSELSLNQVIFEEESGEASPSKLTEVIMVLPEANYEAALNKKASLASAYDFESLEILPIEETVERPLYEVALKTTFDLKLRNDLPDSLIAKRIDKFLHENSSIEGNSKVHTDENGVRYVEIVIEDALEGAKELGIQFTRDANANIQLKRGIESLHHDLSAQEALRVVDSTGMEEAEIRELKKRKEYLEEQKKN